MIKLNKKVEYALIVLKHSQALKENELMNARSICELYKIPFDTTSKVMQVMSSHNILESLQGAKGGYKASMPLSKLSFLDLTQMIEGKKVNRKCLEINCQLTDTCNIIGPVEKLHEYLHCFFSSLSVEKLLESKKVQKL